MSKVDLISKAEANHKWIDERHDQLTKKYNNRWIAVLDGDVIDSDTDLEKITKRLRKKLGLKYSTVVIEYISDKPLNMVLKW